MSAYIVIKNLETNTASVNLCNDGIIRVMLKRKSEITRSDTEENIKAYREISGGKKCAFLIYCEDGTVVYTDEARKRAKELESTFDKTCMAVLVKTLGHKLVANFYLNVYKPNFPYRVFNKMEEAEAWCIEQNKNKYFDRQKTVMI